MEVVKQYSPRTSSGYARKVRTVLRRISSFDYEHVLSYLKEFRASHSAGHYVNTLGALRAYSRYVGMPNLLADFEFPHPPQMPKRFWRKEEIERFYSELSSLKMKALLLMGAATGLRKGEIVGLRIEDVDFDSRTVVPRVHTGKTKSSWVSFYNEECGVVLEQHVESLSPAMKARGKLFPMSCRDFKFEWKMAKEKSSIPLKFKDLRDFFAESMLNLGVQTIYIDALSGRAPASVLARHYLDLSPRKLKQVYDQAGLKVLS